MPHNAQAHCQKWDIIRQSKSLIIYIEWECALVCVVVHLLGDHFVQHAQNTNKSPQKQNVVH